MSMPKSKSREMRLSCDIAHLDVQVALGPCSANSPVGQVQIDRTGPYLVQLRLLGAHLRGRTTAHKEGSEKVLGRVLGVLQFFAKHSEKGSQKGFLEGGFHRRCLQRPLGE